MIILHCKNAREKRTEKLKWKNGGIDNDANLHLLKLPRAQINETPPASKSVIAVTSFIDKPLFRDDPSS